MDTLCRMDFVSEKVSFKYEIVRKTSYKKVNEKKIMSIIAL